MRIRPRWWLVIYIVIVATVGCASLPVHRGDTLIVLWGYTATPQGLVAQREVLIVDRVERGGWIVARNPGDTRPWCCNLGRAVAYTPLPSGEGPTHAPMPAPEPDPQFSVRR